MVSTQTASLHRPSTTLPERPDRYRGCRDPTSPKRERGWWRFASRLKQTSHHPKRIPPGSLDVHSFGGFGTTPKQGHGFVTRASHRSNCNKNHGTSGFWAKLPAKLLFKSHAIEKKTSRVHPAHVEIRRLDLGSPRSRSAMRPGALIFAVTQKCVDPRQELRLVLLRTTPFQRFEAAHVIR